MAAKPVSQHHVNAVLAREIAKVEAADFFSLRDQLTTKERRWHGGAGWFSTGERLSDVLDDDGHRYGLEVWGTGEGDSALHVFVHVYSYDHPEFEASDDTIIRTDT